MKFNIKFLSILFSVFLTPLSLYGDECPLGYHGNSQQLNVEKLQENVELLFDQQLSIQGDNRHILNRKLNHCIPEQDSKVVIIAFEGTGAFEPRVPPLMNQILHCQKGPLSEKLADKVYHMVKDELDKRAIMGRELKWSGLDTGILTELLKSKNGSKIDWFSFPSEESEVLSGLEGIEGFSLSRLLDEVTESVEGWPKGIQSALNCISKYKWNSRRMELKTKLVLVSHSSGARSLVKFAEHLNKRGIEAELAFTIDPVVEAHEAIKEVLPQKIGEPLRWAEYEWERFWGGNPSYPYSKVWSRYHSHSLYKPSNVKKFLSYYQLDDTLGLKMGGDALRFGILGSKISGADQNTHVRNQGNSGHGAICYSSKVLDAFNQAISNLFN